MKFYEGEGSISILKSGGIGVMPTDTIYGIVCSALLPSAVERLYRVRRRDTEKPFIVLILDVSELMRFCIAPNEQDKKMLDGLWPGKVSVIFPCSSPEFFYLHRGTKEIAFRIPADDSLRAFLKKAGPLAAPSANPAGLPPAETIEEARNYFGKEADFYIDGGHITGNPSKLVRLRDGEIEILRAG
ncbi:threonylcarbamoyl-AMP synthase [bacterium]|nr:threonylcarbamoyl-AMP synthase [bacterium]